MTTKSLAGKPKDISESGSSDKVELSLVVIGMRKSGTTWLYENSKLQPGVSVNNSVKETGFFRRKSIKPKDVEYYNSFFSEDPIKAEFDASLCYEAEIVENINNYTKENILVVLILRNPIDYLVSRYQHSLRKNELGSLSLRESVCVDWLKNEMDYKGILQRFNKINRRKIVLPYELLRDDSEIFYKEVYKSVSGDEDLEYFYPRIEGAVNVSRRSRLRLLTGFLSFSAKFSRKLGAHNLVNWVKSFGFHKKLEIENSKNELNGYHYEAAQLVEESFPESLEIWKAIRNDYI